MGSFKDHLPHAHVAVVGTDSERTIFHGLIDLQTMQRDKGVGFRVETK